MREVEAKVYLLAETGLVHSKSCTLPCLEDWLSDLGGSEVLSHVSGSDPEILVELAARRCYKSFKPGLNPNVTKIRTDSEEYHENILKARHGSVLSHATCTFAFEFVSRVFTHELVRNTVGIAHSQESMRYVRLTSIDFPTPSCIAENPEALKIFKETVELLEEKQRKLADLFKIDEMKEFSRKKILTSAFRRIAPDGVATGIVTTFNFRALRWVLEQRTQEAVEEEFRGVMDKLANIVVPRYRHVFQDYDKNGVGEWVPKYSKV